MVETDARTPREVCRAVRLEHRAPQPRRALLPYRAPQLTVYGSLRELTLGYGIGKPDNGVSPSHSIMKKS
jgi:uncharacterized protein YcfJ